MQPFGEREQPWGFQGSGRDCVTQFGSRLGGRPRFYADEVMTLEGGLVPRPSARVVLVDDADRLLLFSARDKVRGS